jgi:hypothetical protein
MKHEDLRRKAEQLADKVGDVLTMEKIELEVVMSVLISMLVSTAISQANMTGVELLRLFSQAVEKYEEATNQMEKEIDDEQTDSRTTH